MALFSPSKELNMCSDQGKIFWCFAFSSHFSLIHHTKCLFFFPSFFSFCFCFRVLKLFNFLTKRDVFITCNEAVKAHWLTLNSIISLHLQSTLPLKKVENQRGFWLPTKINHLAGEKKEVKEMSSEKKFWKSHSFVLKNKFTIECPSQP